MNSIRIALAAIFYATLFPASAAVAGERTAEGVGLTIYSAPHRAQQQIYNPSTRRWELPPQGYAIVKEWRKMELKAGANTLRFQDVAARIDATTVHFKSVTDPDGTAVLEQNYEYDLVSADKILSKYIGRALTLDLADNKTAAGTLLSYDASQIVLQTDDAATPIQILQRGNNVKNIRFGALPGGLITKPTLVWMLDAEKAGTHLVKVTYQTSAMSWNADYTAVISANDKALDLSAWVTIKNQSGASYDNAQLKLVAGDVHRAPAPGSPAAPGAAFLGAKRRAGQAGFQEKSFFEYHLYTLGRKTTLADRSIKQIELFPPVEGVTARKVFLYYGGAGRHSYGGGPYLDRNYGITSNSKVDIYLLFKNKKEFGLGLPLPAGRVRVYKMDEADDSLEFIGEDAIDHTPKDETVQLKLGSAFDIIGERKQTDFQVNYNAHWMKESFEIRLRNHKETDVEVIVKENMYRWANWSIRDQSHAFSKEDARTVHFPLKVKKDGETVLRYTVTYTW
ncbi:MAG: DUF4139 domain-containing protein [Planctomycetota bacterium]